MKKIKLNIFKIAKDIVDVMFVKTVSVRSYYTTNCIYNINIDRMINNVIDFEKTMYKYFNKKYIKIYGDIVAREFNLPTENDEDLGI